MKRMLNQKLIDFLNSLGDSLKYESSTNTFEIGSDLDVDGNLYIDTGLIISGDSNNKGSSIDLSDPDYIYLNGVNDKEAYIEFDIFNNLGVQIGLTDKNTKTLFGNQSIYGSGNIDLYKHYLTINVEDEASNITDTFNILVQSSSNVDCSSATGETQKLKDLLKASGSSIRTYEYGHNNDFSSLGMLLWTGTILCIAASGGELNIVKIVDRVETL